MFEKRHKIGYFELTGKRFCNRNLFLDAAPCQRLVAAAKEHAHSIVTHVGLYGLAGHLSYCR